MLSKMPEDRARGWRHPRRKGGASRCAAEAWRAYPTKATRRLGRGFPPTSRGSPRLRRRPSETHGPRGLFSHGLLLTVQLCRSKPASGSSRFVGGAQPHAHPGVLHSGLLRLVRGDHWTGAFGVPVQVGAFTPCCGGKASYDPHRRDERRRIDHRAIRQPHRGPAPRRRAERRRTRPRRRCLRSR